MQLWALGKQDSKKLLNSKGYDYAAPSPIKPLAPILYTDEMETPRSLIVEEVKQHVAKDDNLLIEFGRRYISNPDIKNKLENNIPFEKHYRDTFYTPGAEGFSSYTRSNGIVVAEKKVKESK